MSPAGEAPENFADLVNLSKAYPRLPSDHILNDAGVFSNLFDVENAMVNEVLRKRNSSKSKPIATIPPGPMLYTSTESELGSDGSLDRLQALVVDAIDKFDSLASLMRSFDRGEHDPRYPEREFYDFMVTQWKRVEPHVAIDQSKRVFLEHTVGGAETSSFFRQLFPFPQTLLQPLSQLPPVSKASHFESSENK